MDSTTTGPLSFGWRLIYTVAVASIFLTTGLLGQLSTPPEFADRQALPAGLVAGLLVLRVVYIWSRRDGLDWPARRGLNIVARIFLGASLIGVAVFAVQFAAGSYIRTQAVDVRGALGLIIGLYLVPFVTVAPVGIAIFEVARGLDTIRAQWSRHRGLILVAAIGGVLAITEPLWGEVVLPSQNILLFNLRGSPMWALAGLTIGALLAAVSPKESFPGRTVFASTVVPSAIAITAYSLVYTIFTTHASGSLPGWFVSVVAGLLDSLSRTARIGLVFAAVPFIASWPIAWFSSSKGRNLASRIVGGAVVAILFSLTGIYSTTDAFKPVPTAVRNLYMDRDERSQQAQMLQTLCKETGSRVLQTVSGVDTVAIDISPQVIEAPFSGLSGVPNIGRPHDWFNSYGDRRIFERVELTQGQIRRAYHRDPKATFGYEDFDASELTPRYVASWTFAQSPEQARYGIARSESRIVDTTNGGLLASQVIYFKRDNNRYGSYVDGCAGEPYFGDFFVFDWVRSVLQP